jgi:hypothetical protein
MLEEKKKGKRLYHKTKSIWYIGTYKYNNDTDIIYSTLNTIMFMV